MDIGRILQCYPPDQCIAAAGEVASIMLSEQRKGSDRIRRPGKVVLDALRRWREDHVWMHPDLYDDDGWALDAPGRAR